MARSAVPFARLISAIKEFAACAPITIQTMLCAIQGRPPPQEETAAWEYLVKELAGIRARAASRTGEGSPGIQDIQLYGKARPAPEDPWATALAPAYLEERCLRKTWTGLSSTFSGKRYKEGKKLSQRIDGQVAAVKPKDSDVYFALSLRFKR